MKKNLSRLTSLILTGAILLALVPCVGVTLGAETDSHAIRDAASLIDALTSSLTETGSDDYYYLENDLVLDEAAWIILDREIENNSALNSVTFGSSDFPFKGTFDGRGHTISGLQCPESSTPQGGTGLFYATDSSSGNRAVIRDLTLKGASIYADGFGGVVAGSATYTDFINVAVEDSFLHVTPADNVLTLITDGGMVGGAIAGVAKNCRFYNCTVRDTNVVCNRTSGVAALGGKGLYLGGIAGNVESSVIEYCRVIGGKVSNRYDNAVGAVGGYTVYAGGVTGWAGDGSKLTDCFSTTTLYTYCATYVSVGSGNTGHCGGITASTNNGLTIRRCHYAGEMSSRQYNAVLVVPVIQNNVNLGGIVGINRGDAATQVFDSYYYSDNNPDATAIGTAETTAAQSYGPRSARAYADRLVWAQDGYDFTGAIARSGGNDSALDYTHYNKWVMWREYTVVDGVETPTGRIIPIHGGSVAVTFSFPGAGQAAVLPVGKPPRLSLDTGETTDDPYTPAVLALYPNKLEAAAAESVSPVKLVFTPASEGYRFVHWHKVTGFSAPQLPQDRRYFERMFSDDTHITASEGFAEYTPNQTTDPVRDNDLYIAHVQAQVVFHDLSGNEIGVDGQVTAEKTYYDYMAALPEVSRTDADSASGYFVGWTETAPAAGANWGNVTDLTQVGTLYQAGDPVEKALSLYPVYADQLAGTVFVQVEGHTDGDFCTDNTLTCTRNDVASATVTKDADGQPQLELTWNGGAAPAGYRFLGWYEYPGMDETTGAYTGEPVKAGQKLTCSIRDLDLSRPHYFQAKFAYAVTLYAPHNSDTGIKLEKYQEVYVPYNVQLFTSVTDDTTRSGSKVWTSDYFQPFDFNWNSTSHKWKFVSWADKSLITGDDFTKSAYEDLQATPGAYAWDSAKVIAPLELAALLEVGSSVGVDYNAIAQTDFPNSGSIVLNSGSGTATRDPSLTIFSGYNYIFFDVIKYKDDGTVRNGHNSKSKGTQSGTGTVSAPIVWDNNVGSNTTYRDTDVYTAHMTADVKFHNSALEGVFQTITRRYRSKLYAPQDELNNRYNTYDQEAAAVLVFDGTGETDVEGAIHIASPVAETGVVPDDDYISGGSREFYFAGWVENERLTATEKAYLLDVTRSENGDPLYQTSSVEKAEAYVVPTDALVERAMELYPLFVPYDVEIKANMSQINSELTTALSDQAKSVTFTGPLTTQVGLTNRTFDILTVRVDDGDETQVAFTRDADTNQWTATVDVTPGAKYRFTAYYTPADATLIFHHRADGTTTYNTIPVGDFIGDRVTVPTPDFHAGNAALNTALFVGWSQVVPAGAYHLDSGVNPLTNDALNRTMMTADLEYYAVYQSWRVKAATDDGTEITGVRDADDPTKVIFTAPEAPAGKDFDGWYDAEGSLLTQETTYVPQDPFADTAVTARYKDQPKTATVVYHKVNGEEFRRVEISSDKSYSYEGNAPISGADLAFVRTVETRVYKKTVDENGQVVDSAEIALDAGWVALNDAQVQIDLGRTLAENQTFATWLWRKGDGTCADFKDFASTPILTSAGDGGEMHLYPAFYTVTLTGADRMDKTDGLIGCGVLYNTDPTDITETAEVTGATFVLPEASLAALGKTLTAHVDYNTWSGGTLAATPVANVPVTLKANETGAALIPDRDVAANPVNTGSDGNAVFTLLEPTATLTLRLAGVMAEGEAAVVTVSGDGYVQTLILTPGRDVILRPAFGTYTVTAAPHSGYTFTIEPGAVTLTAGESESATVTLTAAASTGGATGHWLRGTDRCTNVFGKKEVVGA